MQPSRNRAMDNVWLRSSARLLLCLGFAERFTLCMCVTFGSVWWLVCVCVCSLLVCLRIAQTCVGGIHCVYVCVCAHFRNVNNWLAVFSMRALYWGGLLGVCRYLTVKSVAIRLYQMCRRPPEGVSTFRESETQTKNTLRHKKSKCASERRRDRPADHFHTFAGAG